jgi:hypothetical protein
MRGPRRNLKLGTLLLFPARTERDGAQEARGADFPEPPAAVKGAATKAALALVDETYERATRSIGAADARSSEPSQAIDASTIGDHVTINGVGQQSQETAQPAMREPVPAVQLNDTQWLQSEHAEIVRTARRLAPVDEFQGAGRMTVSPQRKRRQLRLALSAIIAGILLVALMTGDLLLHSFVPASSPATASFVAIAVATAEAPSAAPNPAAAVPEAAVDPGPAAASGAADLPPTQAVEQPEAAPDPPADAWPVTASLPRPRTEEIGSAPKAEEIGSAGNDTTRAAPLPAPESGSTEPLAPASSAVATVDPGPAPPNAEPPPVVASADSAPATTMPEPVPPALESPAAPTEVALSRSTEPSAPVEETIAMVEAPVEETIAIVEAPVVETIAIVEAPVVETIAIVEPEAPVPSAPAVDAPPSAAPAMMVRRGNELLAAGDIISARRFFERAAAMGDATAACGVGKSFDPEFLRQVRARGISGDAATAFVWYRQAAAAGDPEAQARLQRLSIGQRDPSAENQR